MAQWIETLSPSLMTWVQSLKPTWQKERTGFHELSSDLHTYTMACVAAPPQHTNKSINALKKLKINNQKSESDILTKTIELKVRALHVDKTEATLRASGCQQKGAVTVPS